MDTRAHKNPLSSVFRENTRTHTNAHTWRAHNDAQNTKTQTAIKLTVVPCPPVVEVKIKRPDTKYQLGFSVQNGVVRLSTVPGSTIVHTHMLLLCLSFPALSSCLPVTSFLILSLPRSHITEQQETLSHHCLSLLSFLFYVPFSHLLSSTHSPSSSSPCITYTHTHTLSLTHRNSPPPSNRSGKQICSLLRGGIAERGGVRVGHRIIEINGQSVVAVPHERIVNLLATSVGEVIHVSSISFFLSAFRLLFSLLPSDL